MRRLVGSGLGREDRVVHALDRPNGIDDGLSVSRETRQALPPAGHRKQRRSAMVGLLLTG